MMIFPVSLLEEQMDDDHVIGGDETQERSTANKDIPSHACKKTKETREWYVLVHPFCIILF
jgi:hypothetical protein